MHRHIFEDFVNNSLTRIQRIIESVVSLPAFFSGIPLLKLTIARSEQNPEVSTVMQTDRKPIGSCLRVGKRYSWCSKAMWKSSGFFLPFSFSRTPVTWQSCGGESVTAIGSNKSHKKSQGLERPPSSLVGWAAVQKYEASPHGCSLYLSLSPAHHFLPFALARIQTQSPRRVAENNKQGN